MRTLLAGDDPRYLEGLRHLVEAGGHTVVGTAGDGVEALVKARALRPDLILMDIHMPGGSGLEATRRIKAELPEVKVVILSLFGLEPELRECQQHGADGYLIKSHVGKTLGDMLAGIVIMLDPPSSLTA